MLTDINDCKQNAAASSRYESTSAPCREEARSSRTGGCRSGYSHWHPDADGEVRCARRGLAPDDIGCPRGNAPRSTTIWWLPRAAVPRSVVCLISALRFHDIGTQLPAEVWIAVPRGTRVPRVSAPPLRVVNISPAVFDLGIEEHRIEGQTVRIYSIARTVADCFRFRNKSRPRRGARSADGGVAQQTPQAG